MHSPMAMFLIVIRHVFTKHFYSKNNGDVFDRQCFSNQYKLVDAFFVNLTCRKHIQLKNNTPRGD